jgi:hypothetical protein
VVAIGDETDLVAVGFLGDVEADLAAELDRLEASLPAGR